MSTARPRLCSVKGDGSVADNLTRNAGVAADLGAEGAPSGARAFRAVTVTVYRVPGARLSIV